MCYQISAKTVCFRADLSDSREQSSLLYLLLPLWDLPKSSTAVTMATFAFQNTLSIQVLEDSEECGVFVVSVCCGDPLLLGFWLQKPPFWNDQVEQTDVIWQADLPRGLDFVLRARHRAPNLPNIHFWGPFVVGLCLDARPYRFHLPPEALSGDSIQEVMREYGELLLLR